MTSLLHDLAAAFCLFVSASFVIYLCVVTFYLRRRPPVFVDASAGSFEWHILVPALNEASVIEATLLALITETDAHVWAIDDASDDGSDVLLAALAAAHERLHVVSRAYRDLVAWRAANPVDRMDDEATIVGVVDADGRLDPTTFEVLSSGFCFGDSKVGAVQQDVWMRNAADPLPLPRRGRFHNALGRTLNRLQDIEFRAAIGAIQHFRHRTQSVSMGGNGQWTRLTALQSVDANEDGHPWRGSLLEDFELGIHLLMAGWETRFTTGCWVSQEALPDLKRLLRQRVRWCQGSMQCARYIPQLWSSQRVSQTAMVEIAYYLAQPWMFLAGTFLYPIPMIDMFRVIVEHPGQWWTWLTEDYGFLFLLTFVGMATAPLISWGFTYRKVAKAEGFTRFSALRFGFAYAAFVYLSYVIAWRAFIRLVRKQSGWSKTSRLADFTTSDNTEEIETGAAVVGATASSTDRIDGAQLAVPVLFHQLPVEAGRPIVILIGTRPEIIKVAPLARALGSRCEIWHSGQHYDEVMSGSFLDLFDLTVSRQWHLGGTSRGEQLGTMVTALSAGFGETLPAAVIVHGDTTTALAGALAANTASVPLIHLEAGLRSYDRSMPEEHNRVLIDQLADLCLAPTRTARQNLLDVGVDDARIAVTGNTVMDALAHIAPGLDDARRIVESLDLGLRPFEFALATIHRPENTDDSVALGAVLGAFEAADVPVAFAVHPRTTARLESPELGPRYRSLVERGVIIPLPPLPYDTFLAMLQVCAYAISDSGGVQEEVTAFGTPLLVIRRTTERPEVIGTYADIIEAHDPRLVDAVVELAETAALRRELLIDETSPYLAPGGQSPTLATVAALDEFLRVQPPMESRSSMTTSSTIR
jgi:1,2-diacylglycerol 3-beta-glucosyltransferase